MAAKYPKSCDQDNLPLQNDIRLCPLDQKDPDSCNPLSCYDFHMCRDYLLNKRCSEFESNGKCSRSHSLFTRHNQRILEKKLNLSAKSEETFDKISEFIRTSEKKSSRFERPSVPDDDRGIEPISKRVGLMNSERVHDRRSLPPSEPSFSNKDPYDNQSSRKVSISSRLSSSTDYDVSRNTLTNSKYLRATRSIDPIGNQYDQQRDNKRNSTTMQSLSVFNPKEKNDPSLLIDDTDENNNTSSTPRATSRHKISLRAPIRGIISKMKEINPFKSDPNDTVTSDAQLKYVFNKYFKEDQLSFLFGPTRRYLVEHKGYQIFPSGYCRLENMNQEKEIERKLQIALPMTLKTDRIQLPNNDLGFFVSTSAAERILEQNQIRYSIISEPYTASFSIEVIRVPRDDHARSLPVPARKTFSTRLPSQLEKPHLSISDGKFRISTTNSSIEVIRGDITEAKVDLMVCVSSSETLLRSVLSKAGRSIASQYEQKYRSQNSVLLDGGNIPVRKILFIPWEMEVDPSNLMKAQNSLSDLVKRCIDQAYQSKMTSIAFPSIGTGKIGLDPNKVCESMINAANECLHKYKMDVSFVIYPSSGSGQQSDQVFRAYLDDLCKQSRSKRTATPPLSNIPKLSTIPVDRSEQIHRDVKCKRISTVSDSKDITFDHKVLVKSLERLIEEKIFNLTLVQKPFIDQVESLINVCLDYHVLPRIDIAKGDLTLRGDRDSCSQCFANLQNRRLVYKYSIFSKTGRKSEETELNMYVSMKIDEAPTSDESYIRIEDDDKTVFNIDLKASEVHVDGSAQTFDLYRQELNGDSKIVFPKSWSPSSIIRTVEVSRSSSYSIEYIQVFEQTMPKSEWDILRIDAIENWPLYVHYITNNKKSKDDIFAFHGCSFSFVQSIIHYGLHSNPSQPPENSIHLTRDALNSHIRNGRRSTDGTYYMFVVQLSKKLFNHESSFNLTNENAHLVLPTYLIEYKRETVV